MAKEKSNLILRSIDPSLFVNPGGLPKGNLLNESGQHLIDGANKFNESMRPQSKSCIRIHLATNELVCNVVKDHRKPARARTVNT
jgi:hypothetical protein